MTRLYASNFALGTVLLITYLPSSYTLRQELVQIGCEHAMGLSFPKRKIFVPLGWLGMFSGANFSKLIMKDPLSFTIKTIPRSELPLYMHFELSKAFEQALKGRNYNG